MNTQRRAKVGGEYGVNGEWYEGGKWIANTEHAKKLGSRKPTGKQEIAPFVWEVPEEGMRAIYSRFSGTWESDKAGMMKCRNLPVDYWGIEYLEQSQQMADRWNNGERWMTA